MGRKKDSKVVKFQLVQRSYEDLDYDDNKTGVLVPIEEVLKHTKRTVPNQRNRRHRENEEDLYQLGTERETIDDLDGDSDFDAAGEVGAGPCSEEVMAALRKKDMDEDFSSRRNMVMEDDTKEGEEFLFSDAQDAEFDTDFIKQMMYGDVGEEDEEDIRLGGADKRQRGKGILKKQNMSKISYNDDGDKEWCDEDDMFADEEYDEEDDYDDYDKGYTGRPKELEEMYQVHSKSSRAIDRQFEAMMNEFEVDAELNKLEVEDPRAQGVLDVKQYAPLLEEFIDENAGQSYVTDEPLKHKGLINQLRTMTRENRVFDVDDQGGEYIMSVLPDKATRQRQAFKLDKAECRELTLKLAKQQEEFEMQKWIAKKKKVVRRVVEDEETGEEKVIEDVIFEQSDDERNDEKEEKIEMELPKKKLQYDCETILTTATTLYNHPNVIAAEKKKLNMKDVLLRANKMRPNQKGDEEHEANVGQHDEEDSDDVSEEDDDTECITIDPTNRPKNESKEDKQCRRQLVKQLQREKRQQKKEIGCAYKTARGNQAQNKAKVRQDKAQVSLSLATRV